MMRLHTISGSPYGWRVELALRHKALAYERVLHSLDTGALRTEAFLGLNPRGRVPVLEHDGFVLSESGAIVPYLDQAFPDEGALLFPGDLRARATIWRTEREIEAYTAAEIERLVEALLRTPRSRWDRVEISRAARQLTTELDRFEHQLEAREFLCGPSSAADYALFPLLALGLRMDERLDAGMGLADALGPRLRAWQERIRALPYFEATYPPHWRAGG